MAIIWYTYIMTNPNELPNTEREDTQQKQLAEIAAFADKHGITSHEMFIAYELGVGVPLERETKREPIREEVYSLARMIDERVCNGLALNRVAEIIGKAQEYESAVTRFDSLVEVLHVGEIEKSLLRSIVENMRSGTLTITDARTRTVLCELEIPEDVTDGECLQSDVALKIGNILVNVKDRDIEVDFSE